MHVYRTHPNFINQHLVQSHRTKWALHNISYRYCCHYCNVQISSIIVNTVKQTWLKLYTNTDFVGKRKNWTLCYGEDSRLGNEISWNCSDGHSEREAVSYYDMQMREFRIKLGIEPGTFWYLVRQSYHLNQTRAATIYRYIDIVQYLLLQYLAKYVFGIIDILINIFFPIIVQLHIRSNWSWPPTTWLVSFLHGRCDYICLTKPSYC